MSEEARQSAREHFVPQFYLRQWSSRPGHLFALDVHTGAVEETSIRRESCGQGIYGEETESQLSKLEDAVARVVRRVTDRETKSLRGRDAGDLWYFAILQSLRTPHAAQEFMRIADKLMGYFPPGAELEKRNVLSEIQQDRHGIPFMLQCANKVAMRTRRINCRIVHVGGPVLVTSDEPVVRNNPFAAADSFRIAVNGWGSVGLQVVFPLSPEVVAVFYDGRKYVQRSERDTRHSGPLLAGIANTMQLVQADRRVYFSDSRMKEGLVAGWREVRSLRQRYQDSGGLSPGMLDGQTVFHARGRDITRVVPALLPVLQHTSFGARVRRDMRRLWRRFAGGNRGRKGNDR